MNRSTLKPDMLKSAALTGATLVWALAFSSQLDAQERFDPETCFPAHSVLFISVDVPALNSALAESPYGAMLDHPQMRKTFEGALKKLESQARLMALPVAGLLGQDPFVIPKMISGKISIALAQKSGPGSEEVYVAIDMGDKASEFWLMLKKMAQLAKLQGSLDLKMENPRKSDETIIVTPPGMPPVSLLIQGQHLIVVFGGSVTELKARFAAGAKAEGLGSSVEFRKYRESRLEGAIASGFINLRMIEALFKGVIQPLGDSAPAELKIAAETIEATGLTGIDFAGYQLALRDGDFEHHLRLEMPEGPQGYFADFAACFDGPADFAGLDRVPASATHVAAFSFKEGEFYSRILNRTAKLPIPGAEMIVKALTASVEEATGLSIEKDMKPLPRADVTSFCVRPPSGGLLLDHYMLCKIEEVQDYIVLLDKFARHVGAPLQAYEVSGQAVALVKFRGILRSMGIGPSTLLPPGAPDEARAVILALDPNITLAFTPLDDEWLLIADSKQAIERYLLVHSKAVKLGQDSDEVKSVLARAGGRDGTAFGLIGGGADSLAAYNIVVQLASIVAAMLEPALKEAGVDPVQLPPGELFLPRFQSGFVSCRVEKDGITLRAHRLMTHLIPALLPELVMVALRAGLLSLR